MKRHENMSAGHRDRPQVQLGTVWITESWVGAALSLGLGVRVWEVLPVTRLFLLGALGLGVIIGLTLWWKHR
jgi:hypothetical protein